MNSHYLSTSRSNPQFYIFSLVSLPEHIQELKPEWQEQTKQAAWLEFWQREGHDLLEQKWHDYYPYYKQDIELASPETRRAWEELWEQHVQEQSVQFWHIFSCAFENYIGQLHKGLSVKVPRLEESNSDLVEERLAILNIDRGVDNLESSGSNQHGETSDSVDEAKDQLRLLGLPTSFGVQTVRKQSKVSSRPQPAPESDSSECDQDYNMPKEQDSTLHSVIDRSINKKKKRQSWKKNTKIPEFIRQDNSMMKYWLKRFSLFSRFDQGILLDKESWFSVTPEKIAKQTAVRLSGDIIVDAFCGCGGNAIQFAQTCNRVIAIDIDHQKLEMAKNNATIYGVSHKIEFINADFLEFARSTRLRPDVIFLSPPWGGPQYLKQSTFDIEENLLPRGATELMQHARRLTENIGFFLPRNSNLKQIIALSHPGEQCEMEHNYLDTRLVAITAYYGSLVNNQSQKAQK